MTINFQQAEFFVSASKLSQCPIEGGAEVAFAGRSNAGKSSAINTLTGSKKLARISKTPGRTQLINYFSVDEQRYLVDLPGYGYAKVPDAVKDEWRLHMDEYLQGRFSLKGVVLLMDVRHPLREFDTMMLQWAQQRPMPMHILLTKADKLKKGPAKSALLQVEKRLQELSPDSSCQLFSALKRQGLEQLRTKLDQWLV